MGKVNSVTRDHIRRQQLNVIAPYESVSRLIDSILIQLDHLKLELDSWIIEHS